MIEIDIVDIKKAVKDSEIRFYVKDGAIYCQNKSCEVVQLGKAKPFKPILDYPVLPNRLNLGRPIPQERGRATTTDRSVPPEIG